MLNRIKHAFRILFYGDIEPAEKEWKDTPGSVGSECAHVEPPPSTAQPIKYWDAPGFHEGVETPDRWFDEIASSTQSDMAGVVPLWACKGKAEPDPIDAITESLRVIQNSLSRIREVQSEYRREERVSSEAILSDPVDEPFGDAVERGERI